MNPDNFISPVKKIDKNAFKFPGKRFSQIPFWIWNSEMEEDKMQWELEELKDKGIGSFFIHGRIGLKLPYLSEEWFRKIKFTVEKAKELDLKVWIYDEYDWASGTAGLQVPHKNPKLRGKYLEAIFRKFRPPLLSIFNLGDAKYEDLRGAKFIHAAALPTDNSKRSLDNIVDLEVKLSFGKGLFMGTPKLPDEDMTLIIILEKEMSWYIDPFNKEAAKCFLKSTHEKYFNHFHHDLGSSILGFYTDEPAFFYYRNLSDGPTIPWSNVLLDTFFKEKGYDLKKVLPALFLDIGKATSKVRCDYWDVVTELFSKSFYGTISEWCKKHGVLFTGHLLFEDQLRRQVKCEGNVFKHLKNFDIIGVDHIGAWIGTRNTPHGHVAPKIASSAAHQYGSSRVLCETFAAMGWDSNYERMKLVTDWCFALGVDLINPHGFHYSIEGDKKRDFPPSHFYHHPFWKYNKQFTNYVSRLSYMLSGGGHVADVLFLFPIISAWANYVPQERTPLFNMIENDFNYLTDALLRIHIDYDYVDEDVLRTAEINGDSMKIRDESYKILLLPPITTIKKASLKKIQMFYNNGGKILSIGILPFQSAEKGDDTELCQVINEIFGIDPLTVIKENKNRRENNKIQVMMNENKNKGQSYFIKTSNPLHIIDPILELQKTFSKIIDPDVRIDDQEVLYIHKVKDGKDIYFIVNLSEKNKQITVDIRGEGTPELWNPENGETKNIPIYNIEFGRTKIPIKLVGYNSVLIIFNQYSGQPYVTSTNINIDDIKDKGKKGLELLAHSEDTCEGYSVFKNNNQTKNVSLGRFERPITIDLTGKWNFSLEKENTLMLDQWRIMISERQKWIRKSWHEPKYNDKGWRVVNCGPLSSICDKVPGSVCYRTSFMVNGGSIGKLLLDGLRGQDFELFLNGFFVNIDGHRSELDVEITEIDLEGKVCPGINTLVVIIKPSSLMDGLLDPVRIQGFFEVGVEHSINILLPPRNKMLCGKSWTEQGFPYYSGTAIYKKDLFLSDWMMNRRFILDCGNVKNHLEVFVNDEQVGIRLWRPYLLDLTQHLIVGKNSLMLKVTNTAANIICGKKEPSGLLSKIKLVAYDLRRILVSSI